MHLIRIKGSLPHIERFHSRGKHLCKFIVTKESVLHKKRVQLPKDFLGTPTWPPFHCFGTPIWPPWGHVKTLNIALKAITVECNAGTWEINYFWLVYLSYVQTDATTPNVRSWWNNVPSVCTEKFDQFQSLRNNSQLQAATCNKVCKQTQHVRSNNVASVCKGLRACSHGGGEPQGVR